MTPPSATPIERASEPSAARYVPPVDDLWRRSSSNPILVATEEWEGQSVERPAVLWEGGTDWKMWYTGEQTWYEGHAAIGFATSTDGIHWTKRGSNPVYGLGASDLTGPAFGTSVVRHAGTYYLYVSGDDPGMRVATSADGIAWTTRESSITLPPDCDFWGALSVWMDGAVWRMFAVPWHLGLWDTYLYHSADGFNWTIDNDGQPLASLRLHPEGSYGAGSIATVNGVATPWFDGAYHLWYTAVDGPGYTPTDIYHATSTNLIDWTITPRSPVLRHLGTGFEFDQVSFPTVLVVGDLAYLYYEGSDNPAETHAIGVAIGQAIKIPRSLSSPAALPTPTPTPGHPFLGQLVVTVSDRLRVRSQPWVGDDSIRYEPLLPIGTELKVLDGPVEGSGYTWYQVEPLDFALDGPGYGWVAAAGKDGEPWIALAGEAIPTPEGDPWLVPGSTDCPDLPTDLRALKALPSSATLACFSGVPITVEARIVECNCDITLGGDRAPTLFSLDPSPLLLVPPDTTDPPTDHGDWFPLTLDPLGDHPDPLPLGKVVTVTGSFDRPEAAFCTYTEWGGVPTVDPSCRSVFVVTSISKPRP